MTTKQRQHQARNINIANDLERRLDKYSDLITSKYCETTREHPMKTQSLIFRIPSDKLFTGNHLSSNSAGVETRASSPLFDRYFVGSSLIFVHTDLGLRVDFLFLFHFPFFGGGISLLCYSVLLCLQTQVFGVRLGGICVCAHQRGVTILKPSLVSSVLLNLFMQTELYKFKSSLVLNVVKGKRR